MSAHEKHAEIAHVLARSRGALEGGSNNTARKLASQARQDAQSAGEARLEAEAVYREATCRLSQSEHAEAREQLEEAAGRFAALDDSNGLARALALLASAEGKLGNHESALDAAFRAREAVSRVDDLEVRCAVSQNLGIAYCEGGAFAEAQECFDDGARYALAMRDPGLLFTATINAVFLASSRTLYERYVRGLRPDGADVKDAVERLERMLASSPHLEQTRALSFAHALANIALAHALLGQSEQAIACAEEAARCGRRLGLPLILHVAALACAKARLDAGELAAAQEAASEAVLQAGLMASPHMTAVARRLLVDAYEAAGRHQDALREQHLFVRELQADMERRMTHVARSLAWKRELSRKDEAVRSLASKAEQLAVERDSLATMSVTDPLTGLRNRRFVESYLGAALEKVEAGELELAVAFADVDQFKSINDRFSHRVGDAVLMAVADVLRSCLRETDTAARLAGDEFLVLMPATRADAAAALGGRLKEAFRGRDWSVVAPGLSAVSVSVGIAQARPGASLETLIEAADLQMYSDKRATRE